MNRVITESSDTFCNLFDAMASGIAIYSSTDGRSFVFTGMNRAGEQMSDVKFQDIVGMEIREVFPGVTEMGLYDVLARVWATGAAESLPTSLYEDQRVSRYYENRVYKVSATEVAAVYNDITAQKNAEDELLRREEQLRVLFEASHAGILMVAPSGTITLANKRMAEMFGYSMEELLRTSYPDHVHPDEHVTGDDRMRKLITGEINHVATERHYIRKDGSDFWGYLSGRRHEDAGGRLISLVGHIIDITERKQAESERLKLEQQLLHAQKLESLGVLAGGIAHDFNNILMVIIGNADLALMRLNKESPAVENLYRIEQSAARAADLARQMLAYSGKGKFFVENLDLNRLIEEMLHMLEVSISKKAVLRLNLHQPLPTVEADATQLRQILMNLVINASEAIGDKSGVIAITTGCMDCDRSYLKNVWLDENLQGGLYVYLEIADSGCGMDRETMARLFDPFFTTKFTGRGLGMAAVLGIVRGHRGAIKVYSEPGKGTSFKILFPASGRPDELFNGDGRTDDWRGSGTVLLVDDEETVRGIGAEMLKELGFTTITADDGREAVEAFRNSPEISLVILDLTMPRMDGEQCFRELRRLRPDLKVIISSGFNEHEVTQKFIGKGLAGFIQKPYKLSDLKEALRNISAACEQTKQ